MASEPLSESVRLSTSGEQPLNGVQDHYSLEIAVRKWAAIWTFTHNNQTRIIDEPAIDGVSWTQDDFIRQMLNDKYNGRFISQNQDTGSLRREVIRKWFPYREERWHFEGTVYLRT